LEGNGACAEIIHGSGAADFCAAAVIFNKMERQRIGKQCNLVFISSG